MINAKAQIRSRWHNILLLSILFVVIFLSQSILREVIVFKSELDTFKAELNNIEKLKIEKDVNNRILELNSIYESSEQDLLNIINGNVSSLEFAIDSVLANMDTATIEEKRLALVNITQAYNELDDEHLYFIIDTDGYEILSGLTNDITNEYIYNNTDYLNRYYVQDMINSVLSSVDHDAYVTYYYPKVLGGEELQKTSYVKLIEETGYIIGTGAYQEDYDEYILSEIQSNFADYYRDSTEYVYILSGSGEVIFHVNEEMIGQFKDDITDRVWIVAFDIIFDFIEENNEGFVQYTFYEDAIDGSEVTRTAYIVYLADKDFIIGASYNNNTHDELINEFKADRYQNSLLYYIPFFVVLTGIVVLIYYFVKNNINNSVSIFNEEEELYRKFSNLTSEMIVITETDGKILFVNKIGERIIGTRESDLPKFNLNQILGEEDGFYVLRGIKKDYFVKYDRELIMYNTKQCELYFISDVTEKVNTEKALENLVLLDELTGLGNRRKMIKDFNKVITPYVKKSGHEAFLVMLDIDNFKDVNDIHGHIYGDKVLKQISNFLKDISNDNIEVYRVGGDEFTVLIKDTDEKDVFKLFQTLNKRIKKNNWEKSINISFSGGIAVIKSKDKYRRLNDYIEIADKKLYNAKLSGKMKIN